MSGLSSQQVEQSFERVRTFQRDNSKTNAKIMGFIALDNQPFSVVDDVGFRRLVEHQYTLTSSHYLSDVALPELHSNIVTSIL